MGSLFEGRRREGPIVCIILLASSLSWFIIVGKTSKLLLLGFFLPIYTGFLYVCMYGWARALQGEAKSSSNKRSTCSVTTWSSVISAGSPPFCSSFLRAYALSQQHIFFGCCCFFSKLLETRSLKINGGCLWLKHPLRFPCKDKLRINKSPGYLSFSRSTLVRKEGTICC